MAIGYARVEFVKRSEGKTSCAKAAYNSRSLIEFEGNCAIDPQVYDWSSKEDPEFHEILLPEGADQNFAVPEVLWNAVEAKEKRYNSQVGIDLVLALPDDKEISKEDKIELTTRFVQEHIVSKGLGAQIDVHPPERRISFTEPQEELRIKKGMKGSVTHLAPDRMIVAIDHEDRSVEFNPGGFSGFALKEHNWHAHVLITPRRFKEDGKGFEDHKPRDLMPQVRKGKVVAGADWGKLWAVQQNRFFEERGMSLRVDPNGIIPQEHLGPVRMRARAFSLIEEHGRRLELNAEEAKQPIRVLEKLTERASFFSKDDVDRFLLKHVSADSVAEVREGFWRQDGLVRLVDKKTGEVLDKYTSLQVIEEEKKALRLAECLEKNKAFRVKGKAINRCQENLNEEQAAVYNQIIEGRRLGLIQGYAGTGKGHLLSALKEVYGKSGMHVRAFGPDNATVDVLLEKGFAGAENVYRFLFAVHHGNRHFSGRKEVWFLDEAGKLGNRPLVELLKAANKKGAQLVLVGDPSQLSSVERGGLFDLFCKRFGCGALEEIQRQKSVEQREIARNLAIGEVGGALNQLCEARGLRWSNDKMGAVESLVQGWATDRLAFPNDKLLMLAHTNAEVRVLNEMARVVRKQQGEITGREFLCETTQGRIFVSEGDWIEFRKNDRAHGVTNGLSGRLISAEADRFVVSVSEGEKRSRLVSFNPKEYHAFQLGYASTFYRSQGKTVDRAYVLHSEHMNREMFYVGLTRHVHRAQFYLSQDKVLSLADLKRQLMREGKKTTALEFTTHQEMRSQEEAGKKAERIDSLKGSEEFFDQLKGHGLSAWDRVVHSLDEMIGRMQDRKANRDFYSYSDKEDRLNSIEVVEVSDRFQKSPLYNLQALHQHPKSTVVVVDSEDAVKGAQEKLADRGWVFVYGEAKKSDWGALIGRKVVVWPKNSREGLKVAEGVCEELKRVPAEQVFLMNHPKILGQLPEEWSLAADWPKNMNTKLLNYYFPGEEKNGLQLAVLRGLGIPEEDVLERGRICNLLYHFEQGRRGNNEASSQGSSEPEMQKSWKEYKTSALEFIRREKVIEEELRQNPIVCASGDIAKRLARQVLLFEAKQGRSPSTDQLLVMKEAIVTLGRDYMHMDRGGEGAKITAYALDRTIERGCELALERGALSKGDREELQELLQSTKDDMEQQIERSNYKLRALDLQKSIGKEIDR